MKPGAGTREILQTSMGQGVTQINAIAQRVDHGSDRQRGTLIAPLSGWTAWKTWGRDSQVSANGLSGTHVSWRSGQFDRAFMRAVVEGTGSAVRTDAHTPAAAKNRSAEFETGKGTHAWFNVVSPRPNPRRSWSP